MSKLPKIYHNDSVISNNRKTFFNSHEEIVGERVEDNNFFNYFNKNVEIILIDGSICHCKILSKRNNQLLLSDGTHIKIENIKSIK